MLKILFLFINAFISSFGNVQENITPTYVGNMGIFISGDTASFFIDGLHKEYGGHFSQELFDDYLKVNPTALLFASNQIIEKISASKNRMFTISIKKHFNPKTVIATHVSPKIEQKERYLETYFFLI